MATLKFNSTMLLVSLWPGSLIALEKVLACHHNNSRGKLNLWLLSFAHWLFMPGVKFYPFTVEAIALRAILTLVESSVRV